MAIVAVYPAQNIFCVDVITGVFEIQKVSVEVAFHFIFFQQVYSYCNLSNKRID
jgi:hypothetical protein